MNDILGKYQIKQRTPEWYNARKNLLTASEIACIVGKSPFISKNKLKISKCSDVTSKPNIMTNHGVVNEDIAFNLFTKVFDIEAAEVGLFIHPKHTWLGGSPDGVVSDGSLMEIKCPLVRKIQHAIPDYYYCQVQICMEVVDVEQCYFIQYKPEKLHCCGNLDVLVIKRNKIWFDENFPKLEKFWNEVLLMKNTTTVTQKDPVCVKSDDNPIIETKCLIQPYEDDL